MMSEWKDVSRAMRAGMPVWPGDPPVAVRPVARIGEDGASSNVSLWSFSSHAGTHVDPPLHFVPGAPGADALDLGVLCGPCRVMDLSSEDGHITARLLEGSAGDDERILLKTRNSARPHDAFHEDFTAITPDAARWLVDHGIRLIGTDGPSIEAFGSEDFAVHHTLLENAVVAVEGLALADIAPGRYEMVCAPLKWKDADGAPARVLLRTLP